MKERTKNLIAVLLTALAALATVLISVRIWDISLAVPSALDDDTPLMLTLIQSVREEGITGFFHYSRLGAPGSGADLIDMPFLDFNTGLQIYLLTRFLSSETAVLYLLYFLSYPFAAAAMYLTCSRFTKRIPLRMLISYIFAVAPYHFYRFMMHMTLSNYYIVALGIWAACIAAEEPFERFAPKYFAGSPLKIAGFYGVLLLSGLSNVYYALFELIILGCVILYKYVGKDRKTLLFARNELLCIAAVAAGVFLCLFPNILFTRKEGVNLTTKRFPSDTEIFGLKISQFFIPPEYSSSGLLRSIYEKFTENSLFDTESKSAFLGIAGITGLLVIAAWFIYRFCAARKPVNSIHSKRMDFLTLTVAAFILYSTVGGIGLLVSVFVMSSFRAITRVSIFISCCCLLALVTALEHLLDKLPKEKNDLRRRAVCICTALILPITLYAEIDYKAVGWQDEFKAKHQMYTAFYGEMESKLSPGDMVFILPFMLFPESGSMEITPYQHTLPCLYTDTLRFSFGGIKGRNISANLIILKQTPEEQFAAMQESGFAGVLVDANGVTKGLDEMLAFYRDQLGLTPITSVDGTLYFFDIRNVPPIQIADDDT